MNDYVVAGWAYDPLITCHRLKLGMIVMSTIKIDYTPNDKQVLFHKSNADECIYGGAKGGGKSFALVMEALAYALEHPESTLYLFRQTYDDLEANIIMEWQRQVPQEIYTYNAGKYFAKLINGSVVYFRYIRGYDDAARYRGRSIDWIGVDELTEHEEHSIQELMSCLRSPKGFPVRFRATCNPGGIGHGWVKTRYILATNYGQELATCSDTGSVLEFIPATVYDNTVLMENDPNYVRRLENLPEVQREAYLMGNWDVFAGQYYPEWTASVHVVSGIEIPSWWRKFRSLDYGLDTTACYWYAVDSEGKAVAYRELYEPNLSLSEAAEKIVSMTDEDIGYTVASPDLWNRRQDTGRSGVDIMREAGLKGLVKADHRRIPGWRELREWLHVYEDEHGEPTAKIRISSRCPNLIRTLPQLIHCHRNPEDVSDRVEDHGPESLRYFVMSRPGISVEPEVRRARQWRRAQRLRPVVSKVTGY